MPLTYYGPPPVAPGPQRFRGRVGGDCSETLASPSCGWQAGTQWPTLPTTTGNLQVIQAGRAGGFPTVRAGVAPHRVRGGHRDRPQRDPSPGDQVRIGLGIAGPLGLHHHLDHQARPSDRHTTTTTTVAAVPPARYPCWWPTAPGRPGPRPPSPPSSRRPGGTRCLRSTPRPTCPRRTCTTWPASSRKPPASPHRCTSRPRVVAPYSTAVPISSIGTAEVVVVAGPDLTGAATRRHVDARRPRRPRRPPSADRPIGWPAGGVAHNRWPRRSVAPWPLWWRSRRRRPS